MNLTVISDEDELAAAQGRFQEALKREITAEVGVIPGFQGSLTPVPLGVC